MRNAFRNIKNNPNNRDSLNAAPYRYSFGSEANNLSLCTFDSEDSLSLNLLSDHVIPYSDEIACNIDNALYPLGLSRESFDMLMAAMRTLNPHWDPQPIELAEAIVNGCCWELELDEDDPSRTDSHDL
eukprot:Ihof_evm2s271 gene=Ihof_evmTU2s271